MQSCGKATHCDFTENQQAKTTNFNIFEVDRWGLGQPKLRVGLSQLESDTKGFFNGCMKVGFASRPRAASHLNPTLRLKCLQSYRQTSLESAYFAYSPWHRPWTDRLFSVWDLGYETPNKFRHHPAAAAGLRCAWYAAAPWAKIRRGRGSTT